MIHVRRVVMLLTFCALLAMHDVAGDESEYTVPNVDNLFERIQELVEKHYPKAKVQKDKYTLHFEFNTRQFAIHHVGHNGRWNDAREEMGPQPGGIYGSIEVRHGHYVSQLTVPWTDNVLYYKQLRMAPYSYSLDHHLSVRLRYPADAKKEFVDAFGKLVKEFEKHEDSHKPANQDLKGRAGG